MPSSLCISSQKISLLAVSKGQVSKWGESPLASGLVRDGLILNPAEVGREIATLFRSVGIPADRVITSLAGLPFTYRTLSMPRLKGALLDEAIRRAARREIPIALEELYLSWQLLAGGGEELTCFVLGIPRHPIDVLTQTLSIAGISPYLMDLSALALARAARRKQAIIVNMEHDYFDIVLVYGGIPSVLRTVTARGGEATLEDNIRHLADELGRTIAFHQSRYPQDVLERTIPLLLSGSLAMEPFAMSLLQSQVEYPVSLLPAPFICPPNFPAQAYSINMGLVLKKTPPRQATPATTYHDININLMAPKLQQARIKPPPVRKLLLWAALIAAIVLLFPIYQSRQELAAENTASRLELSRLHHEHNLARISNEESDRTEAAIRQMATSARTLAAATQSLLGSRGEFTRRLKLITSLLPTQARFTSIEITTTQVIISGEADNVFTVIDYATALETRTDLAETRIAELDEEPSVIGGEKAPATQPAITKFVITATKEQ